MVIGNGLVAKGFSAYNRDSNIVVFASGVSNSTTTSEAAFSREAGLLSEILRQHTEKKIVYISTCSIYDESLNDSAYVRHKLAMEHLVASGAAHYHIFRISNLAGKTGNPYTVLNFFYQHIRHQQPFQLWQKAYRNIIDIEDAVAIAGYFISRAAYLNQVVNIANPVSYPVTEIVSVIEKMTQKKAVYTTKNKGERPVIDTALAERAISELQLNFAGNYLERVIEKYLLHNDI